MSINITKYETPTVVGSNQNVVAGGVSGCSCGAGNSPKPEANQPETKT